ncbi:MAG: lysylphosphatidylglycerol synthase transmembrane domain-containing protein [Actinomycetota bacterium]
MTTEGVEADSAREASTPDGAEATGGPGRGRRLRWSLLAWLLLPPLIYWVATQVGQLDVRRLLANFRLEGIAALIAVRVLIIAVLTSRWRLFLSAYGYVTRMLSMMSYNLVGFGLSYFTPGPQWGGEPAQIQLVRTREKVSTPHAVASLGLDRILAAISQGSMLAVGVVLVVVGDYGGDFGWRGLLPVFALVGLPLLYMFAIWRNRRPLTTVLRRFPAGGRMDRVVRTVSEMEEQVGELCRNRSAVFWRGVLLSFVVWPVLLGVEFWLAVFFLGTTITIPEVVIVVAASRIAMFTPIPAGVGVLEASQLFAMEVIGLSPALGVALSLLVRARDVIAGCTGLLMGLVYWRQAGRRPNSGGGDAVVTPSPAGGR